MRGRGSKLRRGAVARLALSRPPCGGVDRNMITARMLRWQKVAPHAGAWIETMQRPFRAGHGRVAPHAGAWIETRTWSSVSLRLRVAPHAGAWIETGRAWASGAG